MPHDGIHHTQPIVTGQAKQPYSLLRSGLSVRLAYVAALTLLLWVAVLWALG